MSAGATFNAARDAVDIDPQDALARQRAGALLLDVRDDHERLAGGPDGSVALPLDAIESRITEIEPDRMREIVAVCASGRRSLMAATRLRELGYARAFSVRGGFERWRRDRLPASHGSLDEDAGERYARHLLLPEIGIDGQRRLGDARVALIGAGGLGAPISLYLAAAGVGHITLIDNDRVERSNLQRQVVHADARVGDSKVESARSTLLALNPRIDVIAMNERLRAGNVETLLRDQHVIVDGADNFPTRYLLSAASLRLRIPLVYGAVQRFAGQLSVFDPRRDDSPCYRCLFPEPPAAADAPNCSEAGVLGVLPGTIGLLQATETLKLLLGIGDPLVGRLLCHDALAGRFRELRLPRDPDCPGCGAGAVFTDFETVTEICAGN